MVTTNETGGSIISSDKVEGTAVYNEAGEKLGSIDDLMINKLSGQISYAALEFGGFLGMGTDRYPVPWRMLKYSEQQGGYVVPLNKDLLSKAPKYSEGRIPTFDRSYASQIDTYYNRY